MKNIIICSDGTWQSPESDTSTHVLRLAEGIAPEDAAGNKQVVFYDWGVGSEGDKFSGGITGKGIDKNIQDCYRFVVHNYEPGDALYLFGFSRGAYTVRSLAGLIRNCGILRRASTMSTRASTRPWGVSTCGRWSRWCMRACGGGGRMSRCRTRALGWGSWLGVWGGVA